MVPSVLCPVCGAVSEEVETQYEFAVSADLAEVVPGVAAVLPGTERRAPTGASTWRFSPCGHQAQLARGDVVQTTAGPMTVA